MIKNLSVAIFFVFIVHASTISNWETHRIKLVGGDIHTQIKRHSYSTYWNLPNVNQGEILVQNWEFTITEVYLLALFYFSPIGIIYLFIRNRINDSLTIILSYLGLSLLIGAFTVIIIYIIVGGWSPPGIIPIGTISIIIGSAIGVFKKKQIADPH